MLNKFLLAMKFVKSQMSNNNKLFNDRPVTCVCNVNVLSLIFIDA